MEKIIKVEQKMKKRIAAAAGCKWSDVAVVLFETGHVTVYTNEYGDERKIKYEQITNHYQHGNDDKV